jgi:hypothetical protein
MTKIKSVLAVVLVVGPALGGITNLVAAADQKDVAAALKEYEKKYLKEINSKTDRGDEKKAILKWINSKADKGKGTCLP